MANNNSIGTVPFSGTSRTPLPRPESGGLATLGKKVNKIARGVLGPATGSVEGLAALVNPNDIYRGLVESGENLKQGSLEADPLKLLLGAVGAATVAAENTFVGKATKVLKGQEVFSSSKTQRSNTLPTYEKAKKILDSDIGKNANKLDYGAGQGHSEKLGFDTYEPFPVKENFTPNYVDPAKIPPNSYEGITNLNVLNVVPRQERNEIVKDIGRILKPNGTAIITTRGRDVLATKKGIKGPEDMSVITSSNTYQKGFTQEELKNYLQETLGPSFEVSSIKLGPAGAKIKKLSKYKNKIIKNSKDKVTSKREGGSVVERNPYNYTAKAI